MSDLSSGAPGLPGLAEAHRAPTRIAGRYDIGEVIGVGAPAWVHRAEDRETGRVVAVKLYPTGFGGPGRTRRQRELAQLTGLHHPNLVELLDAGDDSGRAYLVMELVEARTLAQRLLDGTMAPGGVARLGADLGYALAYLHSKGITHRTVKPSNVFLGDRPMLTDFAIAALVDRVGVSGVGSLIGTPAYLAPEQVSGGEVGMAADVYALGLILLEALTGRREFEGDGPETARARLSRRPSIPPGVPAFTDLLHAMTATDPAVRPGAGVVSEALRAAAPELDDVESVQLPTADDDGRRRISTLERLEGVGAPTPPVPGSRTGRPEAGPVPEGLVPAGAGPVRDEPPARDDANGSVDEPVRDDGVRSGEEPDRDDAVGSGVVGSAVVGSGNEPVRDDGVGSGEVADGGDAVGSGVVGSAVVGSGNEPGRDDGVGSGTDAAPGDSGGSGTAAGGSWTAVGGAGTATAEPSGGDGSADGAAQPAPAAAVEGDSPDAPAGRSTRPRVSSAIDAGTKLLDVPPVPAGLPLPPPPSRSSPHHRDVGRHRLLAAVLGVTALAGATVGIFVSESSDEGSPGVSDSAPADSPAADNVPVAQPPAPPPVAPSPPPASVAPPGTRSAPPVDGGGNSGGSKKHKGGGKHGKKH